MKTPLLNNHIKHAFLVLMLACSSVVAFAATKTPSATPTSGDGTAAHPYLVANVGNFVYALNNPTLHYKQTANLDFSANKPWTLEKDFFGTYDGGGFKITNYEVNGNYQEGLFKVLAASGVVKNLTIENGLINTTGNAAGFIAGRNNGTIDNCHTSGSIFGGPGSNSVGGIVGDNRGIVRLCSSSAYIRGANEVGGLVGVNKFQSDPLSVSANSRAMIFNSYSTGEVSVISNSTNALGGGLVGKAELSIIAYCYSSGKVTSTNSSIYLGGLVGRLINSLPPENPVPPAFAPVFLGCYWNTTTSELATSAAGTGKTDAEMKQKATFTNWGLGVAWSMVEGVSSPTINKNVTIWQGKSTDLNDIPNNWDNNALTATYSYIPTNSAFYPTIIGVGTLPRSVQIEYGASISVATSAQATLGAGLLIANQNGYNGIFVDANSTGRAQFMTPADHPLVKVTSKSFINASTTLAPTQTLIGTGLANVTAANITPGTPSSFFISRFDEPTSAWVALKGGTSHVFGLGIGYTTQSKDANQLVTFKGEANSSSHTYTLTANPGTYSGWNLLANPFTTNLDIQSSGNWVYDDTKFASKSAYVHNGGGSYLVATMGGGTPLSTFSGPLKNGEAFFVNVNTGTNLTVNPQARTLTAPSKKSSSANNLITVSAGRYNDVIGVYQNDDATQGYDKNLDVPKLFSTEAAPQLYALAGSEKVCVAAFPELTEGTVVDLELLTPTAGVQTFSMPLENAWLQDLTTGKIYTTSEFTVETQAGEVRPFQLHFGAKNLITSQEASADKIFNMSSRIYVQLNSADTATLEVFTVLGQKVHAQSVSSDSPFIELQKGAYIVRLTSAASQLSQRIVIR